MTTPPEPGPTPGPSGAPFVPSPGWPPVPPPGYYAPPPAYPAPPGYVAVPPGWRPPPPVSPGGLPLADFGTRLAAYLLDGAMLTVVFLAIVMPAFFLVFIPSVRVTPDLAETDDPSLFFRSFLVPLLLLEAGIFVTTLLVYYLYAVEYMHRSGQTLGKKIMKIRIVPLDPARTLTRGMAAKRYLVQHVAGTFVPFFSYIDGFWQLWDKPYLQTLHDKAAQTVVVKVLP